MSYVGQTKKRLQEYEYQFDIHKKTESSVISFIVLDWIVILNEMKFDILKFWRDNELFYKNKTKLKFWHDNESHFIKKD